jgi:hypothetical protein
MRLPALPLLLCAVLLAACAQNPAAGGKHPMPQRADSNPLMQLGKSDIDRMADVEMRENSRSLRILMTKLYKRNPRELRKSTSDSAEKMVRWVFEGRQDWNFQSLGNVRGTDAIRQAFGPEFRGDRVLSLIVGMQSMLIKAHGGKSEFFMTDSIDPQNVYNAARNIEIAVWKLSNARDEAGQLYLLTNEINEAERNLSFEREFGKIIGSLDLYALTLSEKMQRTLTRVAQTLATALFLPF